MICDAKEFSTEETVAFVKTGQRLLHATIAMQTYSIGALFRCQIEAASFLARRFWDDMRLIETLRAEDQFDDTFDVFVNFFQNAACDYANEVGELAAIGAEFASETASRVRKEAQTTTDDMAVTTLAP